MDPATFACDAPSPDRPGSQCEERLPSSGHARESLDLGEILERRGREGGQVAGVWMVCLCLSSEKKKKNNQRKTFLNH